MWWAVTQPMSGRGGHGYYGLQSQLGLHPVDLRERGLVACEIHKGFGVDSGLGKDIGVVRHAPAFHRDGKSVDLAVVAERHGSLFYPGFVGEVEYDGFPVQVVLGSGEREDVGHFTGGVIGLQHRSKFTGTAAAGLDDDFNAVFGAPGCRVGLELGVDFGFVLGQDDGGFFSRIVAAVRKYPADDQQQGDQNQQCFLHA